MVSTKCDTAKPPKEFELIGLRILGAGPGRPLSYSTKMTNYKPPGLIDSMGQFGPWHKDHPSETPISGNYTFTKADLGVFKGIAGTLNSAGKFNGILGRIEVDGETQTPDFQIRMAQHKVPLTTKFHAIVDGTNPKSYGNAMPAGSTVLSRKRCSAGSNAYLLRLPFGVSITT